MYHAGLLNQNKLFQRVGAWTASTPAASAQQLALDLLYRGTAATLNVTRMQALQDLCSSEFRAFAPELTLRPGIVAFWSPTLIELAQEISPSLSTLRIIQNMVLPIAVHALMLGRSVPQSIADAMPRLDSYGLPAEIVSSIKLYWGESGKHVLGYRDVDQHYAAMLHHAHFQIPGDRLVIPLPDDPTERSSARFTFSEGRDAVTYCAKAFMCLHGLLDGLLAHAGFEPTPLRDRIAMGKAGIVESGVKRTIALHVTNARTGTAVEFGHTPEKTAYVRRLPRPSVEPKGHGSPDERERAGSSDVAG